MSETPEMVERVARAIKAKVPYGYGMTAGDAEEYARAAIEAMPCWQSIETVPPGQQVIVWEPMYGWLLCLFSERYGWQIKISGNVYLDLPKEVTPILWHRLPENPALSTSLKEQGDGK